MLALNSILFFSEFVLLPYIYCKCYDSEFECLSKTTECTFNLDISKARLQEYLQMLLELPHKWRFKEKIKNLTTLINITFVFSEAQRRSVDFVWFYITGPNGWD